MCLAGNLSLGIAMYQWLIEARHKKDQVSLEDLIIGDRIDRNLPAVQGKRHVPMDNVASTVGVFGLNNQNDVVGYLYEYGDSNGCFPQAFVWYGQTKTWQTLDAPGGWYTDLYGINSVTTRVEKESMASCSHPWVDN